MASSLSRRVHVAVISWPFDRPCGRFRSGEPRSFYEKTLSVFENQPALQTSSQNFLQKTPRIISKSTLSPDRMGTVLFAKKTSTLSKINSRSPDTHRFLRKHPQIFLKSKYNLTLIIFFFSKKYVWPVDHVHGRARKTSNSTDLVGF